MPTWAFLRHGQSVANLKGWFAGHVDSPLTPRGEEQAIAARDAVRNLSMQRAFCSDLVRARRTAELVLDGLDVPLVLEPALRERSCGSWEGHSIDEIEAAGGLETFVSFMGRPGGGESLRDTAVRALRFLVEVDDGTGALVVAHGGLLRALIGVADRRRRNTIGRWRPRNCELIVRDYPIGRYREVLDRLTC